jgi:hypothetical protein
MNSVNKPKFELGQIVATPGALAALKESNETALPFLLKHQSGDWGEICDDDKKLNNEAISHEGNPNQQQRVLSAYTTAKGVKIWVITEWTRESSCILLPDEY